MGNISQSGSDVWRERRWFFARCFAAWAVISLSSNLALGPINQFIYATGLKTILASADIESGWQLYPYFIQALLLLLCGYVALAFFKEHWLKVGLCIPIIGLAISAWRLGWTVLIFSNSATDTSKLLAKAIAIETAIPLFILAGIALRHYLPPARIPLVWNRLRRWQ